MGWLELKKRAKQFKQQTDEAMLGDILRDNLKSKMPVTCRHSYECVRDRSAAPIEVGAPVRIIDMQDRLEIYAGVKPIGQVDPGQAEEMREQLGFSARKGRSVRGSIAQVSELTETFTVDVAD